MIVWCSRICALVMIASAQASAAPVSAARGRLIRCLANDECKGVEPVLLDEFILDATSAELHLLADRWNWDGGLRGPQAIIRHPRCDRGTALLVYWRASPEYYLRYASRDEVPVEEREQFDLLAEIEAGVLKGQYQNRRIPFDPHKERSSGSMDQTEPKRTIPAAMLVPVKPARPKPARR
jgi:hypothetical protein